MTEPQRCPYRPDIAEPPRQMRALPIDRGYPVPYFVDWFEQKPEFRAMDRRRFVECINKRLCWVCGQELYHEEVFVIGPMCAVNRISSEPPSHRQCAIYSALNCPFLSKPQMVRRKDNLPGPVGEAAGVMIERNPGVTLLYYTKRHSILEVPNGILFQLGRPFKTEWYARGRTATRAEIMESIESGLPILREYAEKHDGPEGVAELGRQLREAMKLIPRQEIGLRL